MNIFYCDDDQDDIDFFKEIIERISPDIHLTVCKDPVDALEMLPNLSPKPDFIFFDCAMPKMDGLECVIAVKRNRDLKKIDLVIISGGLDKRQITNYNKLGVFMFVSKTNMDDLEKSLRGILDRYEIG